MFCWSEKGLELERALLIWVALFSVLGFGFILGVLGALLFTIIDSLRVDPSHFDQFHPGLKMLFFKEKSTGGRNMTILLFRRVGIGNRNSGIKQTFWSKVMKS